jgi:sulfate transport system ATP-binding protein
LSANNALPKAFPPSVLSALKAIFFMSISIDRVSKQFGSFQALDDVSLEIASGELVALLGPSGCGKTTLLRIIAGLESADVGSIYFSGVDATAVHPRERNVGFVFQHYALFRHMTVFDNVAFGLRMRPRASRPTEAQIKDKVHQLLDLVQLDWLGDRYPAQLSGGQRQRIALARALAVEPQVLLLDEPFGALDAKVRKELRRWLRRLHDELHVSSVFVTHDQEEALEVSDRVVLMNRGRIEQVGTPQQVWQQPASPFVFSFLGQVNRLQGHIEDGSLRIGTGQARIACPELQQAAPHQEAYAFVRPYDLELRRANASDTPADGTGWIEGQVLRVLAAGPLVRLEITPQDASILPQGEVLEVHLGLQEYAAMPLRDVDPVQLRPRGGRVFLA